MLKRSPLRRGKPLKRTRMRRKPRSTSYSRRERDMARMGWIKTRSCAVLVTNHALSLARSMFAELVPSAVLTLWTGREIDICSGVIEAHHAGEHGLGNKAADDTCIPLCVHHHRSLTDRLGIFAGWPPRSLKAWELAVVAHYQALYAEHVAAQPAPLY